MNWLVDCNPRKHTQKLLFFSGVTKVVSVFFLLFLPTPHFLSINQPYLNQKKKMSMRYVRDSASVAAAVDKELMSTQAFSLDQLVSYKKLWAQGPSG